MPSYRTPPRQRAADWSDGETSVLIGAWGPAHQRCGRLALKDWRAVASAVNPHGAAQGRRYNRTRAQCRNRVGSLKRRYRKELLSEPPPSGWRHLRSLRAFLADLDGPPPGFPAVKTTTLASVKEEKAETNGEKDEEAGGGGGLASGSWTVPRKPRNGTGGAGLCPAAVVTKLAEVYERVELARLNSDKVKMEVEAEMALFDAVKMEY